MRISFKNFKSYKSLTDINVNKFNVVLGKNNSGKSTLSEAIAYFNSIFWIAGSFYMALMICHHFTILFATNKLMVKSFIKTH